MLTPRFTLRTALKGVTIYALVALIAGQAVAGQYWAIAAIIALAGVVFFFGVYAASYLLMKLVPVDGRSQVIESATPVDSNSMELPPRSST